MKKKTSYEAAGTAQTALHRELQKNPVPGHLRTGIDNSAEDGWFVIVIAINPRSIRHRIPERKNGVLVKLRAYSLAKNDPQQRRSP